MDMLIADGEPASIAFLQALNSASIASRSTFASSTAAHI
jgi:hypothetical protein